MMQNHNSSNHKRAHYNQTIYLQSPEETQQAGAQLAALVETPMVIFLEGELGAGKTTFVRGFLRALGCNLPVKSPTFTLVETYECQHKQIVHADLYRLKNVVELETIGFRDYLTENSITLVEWASVAIEWLPKPQLLCKLKKMVDKEGRLLEIMECSIS